MLHQTKAALGIETPPVPYSSGMVAAAIFEHTFTTAFTAASDKLELGVLPAGARVIGATLIGEGLGAITADVGIMSGEPGVEDDTRTVGTDFFNDQSVNDTEADAATGTVIAIATGGTHRSIGATLSGDVAAGAAKKLKMVLQYTY